jgi:hypothetical protein
MPERIAISLAPSRSAVRQRERVLSRPRTSPVWAVGTGIAGPTAGFNSHRPCRPTRLRSIRLQRRLAPCRTRQLPRGTSLNPHAFPRSRSVIPRSCRPLFRHDGARRSPAGSDFFGARRAGGQSFVTDLGRVRRRLSRPPHRALARSVRGLFAACCCAGRMYTTGSTNAPKRA